MSIASFVQKIKGFITVQVEGFFTERFINLCKINNVKIWDIRNIVKGVVRFKINIADFKKLRTIAKKTKCKVTIKNKEGIYFVLFKYRKRKIIVFLIAIAIFFTIAFSTFIWNIEIEGNVSISDEELIEDLKESGLYVGKSKIGLDKKEIINNIRVNIQDISWVGIELDGTLAKVKVVEKTKLDSKNIQNNKIGDIIAKKDGVITKIVPEKGTAMLNEKSFVEKGNVLIEGKMYSKILEPFDVTAKGIVKANCEYVYENTYRFQKIIKEYTKKKMYTVGITINSKENMLNYLNKSKNYDISKSSKVFNIFGIEISLDLYRCDEYIENNITSSKQELIEQNKNDIENYLNNEILPNTVLGEFVDSDTIYTDIEDGFISKTIYTINEEIGEFIERNNVKINEQSTD